MGQLIARPLTAVLLAVVVCPVPARSDTPPAAVPAPTIDQLSLPARGPVRVDYGTETVARGIDLAAPHLAPGDLALTVASPLPSPCASLRALPPVRPATVDLLGGHLTRAPPLR